MNQDELDRSGELNSILDKAERTLQSAENSFNDGFVESAASRAYYAAFHAVQAVLASDNQAYSKHSAVIAQFQRQFVKTGIFPSKLGKALKTMMLHREIGDYSYNKKLSPDEVKDDIEKARELLSMVRQYLKLH